MLNGNVIKQTRWNENDPLPLSNAIIDVLASYSLLMPIRDGLIVVWRKALQIIVYGDCILDI